LMYINRQFIGKVQKSVKTPNLKWVTAQKDSTIINLCFSIQFDLSVLNFLHSLYLTQHTAFISRPEHSIEMF
jgi:hypothetical protein